LINSRTRIIVPAALASLLALTALPAAGSESDRGESQLSKINHIVVIYQENRSFDSLYGGWEGINGLANAPSSKTFQVSQAGAVYSCLLQNDVNLKTPPLSKVCSGTKANGAPFDSHFTNAPFRIDDFITPSDTTCPAPGVFAPFGVAKGSGQPGGCTRDIVHRFYQEQYQLNGGQQSRYVTGSDAAGLAMGVLDTKALPIYAYLHQEDHPHYAIADNFFQGSFGGSFLNHQWLVAANTPVWRGTNGSRAINDGSSSDLHSVVDANGMPNNYDLYASPLGPNSSPTGPKDGALTASCTPPSPRPATPAGVVCGDYAVNTIQPVNQPYQPGTGIARRLPALTTPNVGDRLSANAIDWAWYSGGWDNAAGNTASQWYTNGPGPTCADPHHFSIPVQATYPNCPDQLFMFHHQPLNYFANYAPGTTARVQHLRDEGEFVQLATSSTSQQCNLKAVSFVKPIGEQNEHPGYTSENPGSEHLVQLLQAIQGSACKRDTMVVVTYDEFGGQWDHVAPPGQGTAAGPHDQWGPGTRVPALIIAPRLPGDFVVDGAQHDTTSILATIEHRFGLAPLGTRDAAATDLSTVFSAREVGDGGGD
jgi:phospholipase C